MRYWRQLRALQLPAEVREVHCKHWQRLRYSIE